jgi:glutamine---fructose-6-phosphate transaminase (isomerizing)
MAAEMAEQPEVLGRLIERRDQIAERIGAVLPKDLSGIVLVARGSSDHAALYGRYLLQATVGRPVSLAAPSLHTIYGLPLDASGYLAVAVSQSGRTPEIATVLRLLRSSGATGIALTNDPDSPLAKAADAIITLDAGEERAIPATKTFTAELAAFALLAEALGRAPWRVEDWGRIPQAVREALADAEPPRRVAEGLAGATGMVIVARGFLLAIAFEGALKIQETTGLLALPFSSADLRHGPIAILRRRYPLVAIAGPGPAGADVEEVAARARAEGDPAFVVGVSQGADVRLPGSVPEALLPIPAAVRAQQVAHALSLRLGMDPDAPAGLTKVTKTS